MRLLRLMNESIRTRSAALQKPDHAGLQYSSLVNTVALYTLWRASVGMPCERSTRSAYSDLEQAEMVAVTCSSADRRSLTTTPSIVILLTLSMPLTTGGGQALASAPRTPGAVRIISKDLVWLSSRLLTAAQSLTCFSSVTQVCEFPPGISKYVSSANLKSLFSAPIEHKSEAFTIYYIRSRANG